MDMVKITAPTQPFSFLMYVYVVKQVEHFLERYVKNERCLVYRIASHRIIAYNNELVHQKRLCAQYIEYAKLN